MNTLLEIISYTILFLTIYFEVFMIIALLGENKKNDSSPLNVHYPSVTVIVPCYNEENTIANTIHSLLQLNYPEGKLDIIVVNDGSSDKTGEILKKYDGEKRITLINKENGGKYTALNIGISRAKTDLIGCLDADSYVDRNALKSIIPHFVDPEVMAVTPSIVVATPKTFIQRMQKAEYDYGNFFRRALSLVGAMYVTPGPFSFFRKEVFEKIGDYKHAHSTEDIEMAMRMHQNSMKIVHAPDTVVYTSSPETMKKLYRQRVRWTSGFFSNIVDYKTILFNKKFGALGMLVLPLAVIGSIMTIPFFLINAGHIIKSLWTNAEQIYFGGISRMFSFEFDPFFINTSTLSILSILLLGATIIILAWSRKIIGKKWTWDFSFIYLLFYTFIYPFWVAKSIYNSMIAKKGVSWR